MNLNMKTPPLASDAVLTVSPQRTLYGLSSVSSLLACGRAHLKTTHVKGGKRRHCPLQCR
jgi:hypothetical protein